MDDLRAEVQARGRDVQFEVFRRYDLADMRDEAQPSYAEVATALGLTVATVTNHLAAMRRLLRARVLDRLREATGSDAEYEAEAKRLLGSRPMTALDDGAVARLRAAADVPDLGDRYVVRAPIGHGGLSVVYAAFDRALAREVAVKVADAYSVDARRPSTGSPERPVSSPPSNIPGLCRCTTPA